MGPVVVPDNLTITLAVGSSLFDSRFGLATKKPAQLKPMPSFANDALVAELCHGDLLVQICSNTPDSNIHALRDIRVKAHAGPADDALEAGKVSVPPPRARQAKNNPRRAICSAASRRTAPPNPETDGDEVEMKRLVWVQPGSAEPAWAAPMAAMAWCASSATASRRWDRTPLQEQEAIIGRHKPTGAPLGGPERQLDTPVYHNDPEGKRTPLDAHIRLANPRTPETEKNIILRRPFNYSNGVSKSGQLEMGLLFICFQSDLAAGFATMCRPG